jgi:hypothetical protein
MVLVEVVDVEVIRFVAADIIPLEKIAQPEVRGKPRMR